MILNCDVLHRIEAEKTPSKQPNEPTSLRNTALNREFGKLDFFFYGYGGLNETLPFVLCCLHIMDNTAKSLT